MQKEGRAKLHFKISLKSLWHASSDLKNNCVFKTAKINNQAKV